MTRSFLRSRDGLAIVLLTGVAAVLAIGTAWLAVRAAQPHAEAVPT